MLSAQELAATGNMFHRDGDFEAARFHYLAALEQRPDDLSTLANLAVVLNERGNLDASLAIARRVSAAAPQDGAQWNNLANILMRSQRLDEVEAAIGHAVELSPDDPGTWHNYALFCYRLGRVDEALAHIDRMLELQPGTAQAKTDRAHMILASGRLQDGLDAYELRWNQLVHLQPWDLRIPEWKGEDLAAKSLLLHSEQGFGDAIMLLRLAPELIERGARLTVAVPPGLVRLAHQQRWDANVISLEAVEAPLSWDYHTPMFSALRWLGYERDTISPRPYLNAARPVDAPDVPAGELNVGICWASGKWNLDASMRRIIPLELFLPLSAVPGTRLWSLQKGEHEEDIARTGAEALVRNVTGRFSDWADTAAFIAKLDLVIAVDTAVAHLAGALGKPVWMLSQFTRCWRWWDRPNGTMLPWYAGKIFSQEHPVLWDGAMARVHRALAEFADERKARLAA